MKVSLKTRVAKLEQRLAAKNEGFSVSILIGLYEGNSDNIVGAGVGDKRVERRVGESVDALSARASRELGMQVLFAIYVDGTEAS